jgi:hypothetical protein
LENSSEDKNLDGLRAELKSANFPKIIREYCDIYERTEHELASGLEVSPEDRAEHERIKRRIQSGYSLRDAMVLWNVEMYLKMWDRDHPGMLKQTRPRI